ncbi:MAG: class I SAM-dependent methyltransferase [Candidatus Omnitrophota bacterium]
MRKQGIDLRNILSWPLAYGFFSNILAPGKTYPIVAKEYIKSQAGDRILDLGCGIARILNYLPCVEYTGLDMNRRYIEKAKKTYGERGAFVCEEVSAELIDRFKDHDIVLALGVLHHIDDAKAEQLFKIAKSALKAGGRLITFDGCYVHRQNRFARYLLSKDRGKYVRTKDEYVAIASRVFSRVAVDVRTDLIFIPYNHIIMECSA